jgi:hypothetical protein
VRAADFAILAIGIVAILLTLADVFQSVVVPRAAAPALRISYVLWRVTWKLWPPVARWIHPNDARKREEFLGVFAPFAMIAMVATWVIVLVLAFGAVLWALRDQLRPEPVSYWDAAYFSGSSLLTIGFGDIVPKNGLAKFVALAAGASGLSVVSITTAFLFAIFGTFQRREAFIVTLAGRAGSPPSGIGIFEIAAVTNTQRSLGRLMRDAQDWIAALMESHLAYPVLAYFRSSHDDQSWIGTLGAMLDASLVANTMLDYGEHGEARICFAIGRHAVHDLCHYFRIGVGANAKHDPGIERSDFDRAYARLGEAGYSLREADTAWREFSQMRMQYAGRLNALAEFFHIPPMQWIGERVTLSPLLH